MTAQAGYAGYSGWYQVGSQFLAQSKAQDDDDFLSTLFLQSALREFAEYEKLFMIHFQQPQYGSYGYQNTWNYNQGYYPPT